MFSSLFYQTYTKHEIKYRPVNWRQPCVHAKTEQTMLCVKPNKIHIHQSSHKTSRYLPSSKNILLLYNQNPFIDTAMIKLHFKDHLGILQQIVVDTYLAGLVINGKCVI